MTWDLIEEAKKLIAVRSCGNEGNRKAVNFVVPFMERIGFNLTYQAPLNGNADIDVNLIAHTVAKGSADLCPQGLLFMTHLDTVPAGDLSLWTETGNDPFNATVKDGKLIGLGSADTKVDILCKLKAIETVGIKNLKIPFALIASYGEESGLKGVKRLRESKIVHPRMALISEASEVKPVLKHKGILYMTVSFKSPSPTHPVSGGKGIKKEFKGKAAHGATPHLGENAIEKGVAWLLKEVEKKPNLQLLTIKGGTVHNVVPEYCQIEVAEGSQPCPRIDFLKKFWKILDVVDEKILGDRDSAFNPDKTTKNVGVVRMKGEEVELEFDYRLIPVTDGNELSEILKGIDRVSGAKLKVISSNAPMNTDENSELATRVKKAMTTIGEKIEFQVKAGNTEGAILSSMGADAIVIGPGVAMGNIHRPNEYNRLTDLKTAVKFYTAFLRQFT
jgi:acetylornithine deacetylase/succinyl-diaminopimelate desuccinylase-like protein